MTNGIAFKVETNITQGARLRGRNGVNREEADPNASGCKQNSIFAVFGLLAARDHK